MIILKYLFIFALFSLVGWLLEVIYRSTINKKFINPGFMTGCVLPLYGFGVVILNILCSYFNNINSNHKLLLIFIISMIILTLLEYITGVIMINVFHVKLWDYSNVKFNYKGIICLQFSIIWGLLATIFYKVIFTWINTYSEYFINNTLGIFSLGIFYGIFIIDLVVSINLIEKIRNYSKEIKKIINIENFKVETLKLNRNKVLNIIYPYLHINKYLKDKMKRKK